MCAYVGVAKGDLSIGAWFCAVVCSSSFLNLCVCVCVCDLVDSLLAFTRQSWADHFNPRNLNAFSAHPLLVYPTHYVGDAGWYSDTGKVWFNGWGHNGRGQ